QGALASTYSLGYRVGLILAGAVALFLADHVSWSAVYGLMAACMAVPITANLLVREPVVQVQSIPSWKEGMAVGRVGPLADLFRRYGLWTAALTLLFVLLFKIPEQALVGGIMSPFYMDMGFSKTQIAAVTKVYGIWISMAGVFLGGAAVARLGLRRPLLT